MYRRGLIRGENYENWPVWSVTLTIRAPNRIWARKLVESGFDLTMLWEDKEAHKPRVDAVMKLEDLEE